MASAPLVAFYVSGHGYGHATRSVELIRHLLRWARVVVVSAAPQRIFAEVLDAPTAQTPLLLPWSFRPCAADLGGVVQLTPFKIDVDRTRARVEAVLARRTADVDEETAWLRKTGVDVVVVDVAFTPLAAAQRAGVPGVIASNFTWDTIYAPFVPPDVRERITDDYRCASLLLRLPGWIEIPSRSDIPTIVDNVPLVVRATIDTRTAVRERFNIPLDAKAVLIQFGGHDYSLPWDQLQLPSGWFGLVCGPISSADLGKGTVLPPHLRTVPADTHIPDVCAAVEVMVGKLGYGTCSEALAAGTPVVFVRRKDFVEEAGLEALLQSHNLPALELEDITGNWASVIERAHAMRLTTPPSLKRCNGDSHLDHTVDTLCTQGASVCSQHIRKLVQGDM